MKASLLLLLGALSLAPATEPVRPELGKASQKVDLKLATLVPDGSVWDRSVRQMADNVKKGSEGRVAFRIYSGGVAGDEPDVLRKMRIGQLHAAVLTQIGLAEIDPAFRVFEIPMYFESEEEAVHVLRSMRAFYEERLEERGFRMLGWAHAGWVRFFSTEPIHEVQDLKRQKLFVWAGNNRMLEWYRGEGFSPVPLAATDAYTGLQTGLIQTLPSTPLAVLSLQWFRSAPNMLDFPVAPLFGATIVTERAWKRLSEEDRALLRKEGEVVGRYLMEEVPRQGERAIEEMVKRGLTLTEPGADLAPWRKVAESYGDALRRDVVPPEAFQAFADEVQAYRRARQEVAD